MKKPTLSVLMGNYNHSKYIGEALDAILNQSFPPTEIIISDHSSTDNSVEIINWYVKNNNNVRMISTPRSVGIIEQFNNLVSLASGEYLYGASCDDKILPGFFEKSVRMLEEYPDSGLCCSAQQSFNDTTNEIRQHDFLPLDTSLYFSPEEVLNLFKETNLFIPGVTSIVRKSCLNAAGCFLPELKWSCDWFAFLVIAFRHGICYIPEPLASSRITEESYSGIGYRNWNEHKNVIYNLIKYLISNKYQDTLPYFQRSGVMSQLGANFLKGYFSYPQLWNRKTLKLIPRNNKTIKYIAYSITPNYLINIYNVVKKARIMK